MTDTISLVDPFRLGTGGPDDTKVLYGDQVWRVPGAPPTLYVAFLQRTAIVDTSTDFVWTDQPAALTEMVVKLRRWVDLSNVTEVRFVADVATAGTAGAELLLQYSTDGGTSFNGTGAGALSISSTGTKDGGWLSLVVGARTFVTLSAFGQNGNATADPRFNLVSAQFR